MAPARWGALRQSLCLLLPRQEGRNLTCPPRPIRPQHLALRISPQKPPESHAPGHFTVAYSNYVAFSCVSVSQSRRSVLRSATAHALCASRACAPPRPPLRIGEDAPRLGPAETPWIDSLCSGRAGLKDLTPRLPREALNADPGDSMKDISEAIHAMEAAARFELGDAAGTLLCCR
jgi:hypothetical protein